MSHPRHAQACFIQMYDMTHSYETRLIHMRHDLFARVILDIHMYMHVHPREEGGREGVEKGKEQGREGGREGDRQAERNENARIESV